MSDPLDALRSAQRQTWAAGDYAAVGKNLEPAAGGRVTGLDFTAPLLDVARTRVAVQGLSADFLEGDAEDMPLPDASFDRVLSLFGVMFAPDHRRAANELWRVCKPGGRIVLASWTPTGGISQLFGALQAGAPEPPPASSPHRCGGPRSICGRCSRKASCPPAWSSCRSATRRWTTGLPSTR